MHVKLATLRVILALGAQIYKLEAMERNVIDRTKMSQSGLGESVHGLGESGRKTLIPSGYESNQWVEW